MGELSKEIFETDDREREEVEAWGHTFFLRELSAADIQFVDTRRDNATKLAATIARSAVDEDGKCLFSDTDLAKIANKGLVTLQRLQGIIEKLTGLAETAEEAEKNSEATASDGPG